MSTSASVCFVLHGAALARRARDLVASGAWEDGLALLRDSLDGIGMDHCLLLLSGKATLTGTSPEVDLTDEIPEDQADEVSAFVQELRHSVAGKVRLEGGWHAPYGFAASIPAAACRGELAAMHSRFHPDMLDVHLATLEAGIGRAGADEAFRHALARDLVRDLAVRFSHPKLPGDGVAVALFARCDPPPFWLAPACPRDPGAAAREAFEAGLLSDLLTEARRRVPGGFHPDTDGGAAAKAIDATAPGPANQSLLDADAIDPVDPEARRQDRRAALLQEEADAADELAVEAQQRAAWKVLIRARAEASGGFVDVLLPDADCVLVAHSVPKAPLIAWASRRRLGLPMPNPEDPAATWIPVCPRDLKLENDDPFHSDWMVGTEPSFPLELWYDHWSPRGAAFEAAAFELLARLQDELLGFEVAVLSGRGSAEGPVVHPGPDQEVPPGSIVVIPHCGAEYFIPAVAAARGGGAVIAERGGRMSHLAVVGLEHGLRILLDPQARTKYPPGAMVRVDADHGRLRLLAVPLG